MEMKFGPSDDRWGEYNLHELPLIYNNEDTKYKAIVKGGELISIVSNRYRLLPNEEAVKIADEAATLCELVPFSDFTGPWLTRMGEHTILENNKVHALYALETPYKVNDDNVYLGVGVHNSIDGSMGFGCGVFTFRVACANMVFAGFRGYTQMFDQRKTIRHIYQKHTSGLEPIMENLKETILGVMENALDILESYKRMARETVTKELIKSIKENTQISEKLLPTYLEAELDTLKLEDFTVWDLYNDLTANIWHNVGTSLHTKINQYQQIHRLMPLTV